MTKRITYYSRLPCEKQYDICQRGLYSYTAQDCLGKKKIWKRQNKMDIWIFFSDLLVGQLDNSVCIFLKVRFVDVEHPSADRLSARWARSVGFRPLLYAIRAKAMVTHQGNGNLDHIVQTNHTAGIFAGISRLPDERVQIRAKRPQKRVVAFDKVPQFFNNSDKGSQLVGTGLAQDKNCVSQSIRHVLPERAQPDECFPVFR